MTLSAAIHDAAVAVPPWREGTGAARVAVHAPDEDSLTLAWQAGRALLDRHARTRIAALLLATTTAPVTDGGNASVLADALRLDTEGLLVQEYGGGLSASGAALATAAALVSSGVAPVLVLLADTRRRHGGRAFGSGAAALLVTADGPVRLHLMGADADSTREVYALGGGTVDAEPGFTRWLASRAAAGAAEPGIHTVTVRPGSPGLPGIGHLGCAAAWAEAVARLNRDGNGGADPDPASETRVQLDIGGGARYRLRLDFAPGYRPDPGPLGLAAAADTDACAAAAPPGLAPIDGFDPFTSVAQAWRDRREELRLTGMWCAACEAPEYPAAPACPRHGPAADLRPHEMARTGRVLSRTSDHVFPVGGPLTTAVVRLDSGGRFYGQVAAGHDAAIGDEVELVLRRIATAPGAAPRYFWKILPVTDGTGR
ncbi:hypothetical protein [Peterkaempfera bronchialis]|uniref:hypothetical protein n=1 Tax=Peterkaempfera bronchialis TaxID=2126346 RepID=UPI0013B4229D|nr:hypothetical protein [Peterkaempfera bronchialis]